MVYPARSSRWKQRSNALSFRNGLPH
jgi:hypothetical protein